MESPLSEARGKKILGRGAAKVTDLMTFPTGMVVLFCVFPQLIFVVKVVLALCAKVVT